MPPDGVVSDSFAIRVFGAIRRYLLIRPDGTDPATLPTVVDLHGSGSWPEEHVAITDARAFAARGAIVAVPEAGVRFQMLAGWPTGWAWNVPGSVDPRRIHLRGFSGGARLASHVMAGMTDRLTSVCCVAGVRFVEPAAGRLPPLLAIHGSLDAVNPRLGGSGPRWSESVESAVSRWAAAHGCAPEPERREVCAGVREARYVDADGFAAVRLLDVANAEHSWPGTRHRDHVEQFGAPGSWDAALAHWDFVHEVERNDTR
jgi:polyhydroxybutyrate depolymerase